MLIIMATALPEDSLLDELTKAIKEYRTTPNDENKNALQGWAAMIGIKMLTGDSYVKMTKMMDDLAKRGKVKPSQN